MTYFRDGVPYSYAGQAAEHLVCAGWLGRWRRFRRAKAPDEFVNRLAWRCLHQSDRACRGIHVCELCPAGGADHVSILQSGKKHPLGNAEITVIARERTYAAPNLILHYVVAHAYLPPDDFVEAIMLGAPGETLDDWSLFIGSPWEE